MNQETNIVINGAFEIVKHLSRKFDIDDSHAMKHSIEVFKFATRIYNSELQNYPYLQNHQNIIAAAAILHDMCDKKYMPEEEGVAEIRKLASLFISEEELDIVVQIITTMSYSKVKQNGHPDLGEFQTAYHIVREADLLAAYDIDRCIVFSMYKENMSYMDALARANNLFKNRVLNYRKDGLFVTEFSKKLSKKLHANAILVF
jgi:HD superfamily phosphodiesterase